MRERAGREHGGGGGGGARGRGRHCYSARLAPFAWGTLYGRQQRHLKARNDSAALVQVDAAFGLESIGRTRAWVDAVNRI